MINKYIDFFEKQLDTERNIMILNTVIAVAHGQISDYKNKENFEEYVVNKYKHITEDMFRKTLSNISLEQMKKRKHLSLYEYSSQFAVATYPEQTKEADFEEFVNSGVRYITTDSYNQFFKEKTEPKNKDNLFYLFNCNALVNSKLETVSIKTLFDKVEIAGYSYDLVIEYFHYTYNQYKHFEDTYDFDENMKITMFSNSEVSCEILFKDLKNIAKG